LGEEDFVRSILKPKLTRRRNTGAHGYTMPEIEQICRVILSGRAMIEGYYLETVMAEPDPFVA
jgi:hypothetical protein